MGDPPLRDPIREPHSGTPIKGTHQGTFRETPFMGKTLCKGMRVSSDTQPGDRRRVGGRGATMHGKSKTECLLLLHTRGQGEEAEPEEELV